MFVRRAGSKRLRATLAGLTVAGALVLALSALAPGLTPGAQASPATKNDPGAISLDIVQPAPNNGIAEGPVGANILAQGSGATAGDAIQIGIAPRSAGCASGFESLNISATAAGDGSFSAVLSWPQIANNVGDRYYICAQDTTASSVGASKSLFQIDSSDAPAISVTQVNDPNAPTPGAGTPTPTQPNPPDGTLYAGGFVEIKGQNFTPGGTAIQVLVTPTQLTPGLASSPQLQIVKGAAVSKHDGSFDVFAQLPGGQTGQFYISATSPDGTSSVLPTLVGSQSAKIALAPTPTPSSTVTPTPNSTASVGPGTTQPKQSSGPGTGQVIGAIALGLFSAIFFILGVAMLISASGMAPDTTAPGRPQLR
ncbi:MAG TPA: hypothetical protein VE338_08725 [Ktedonobacterales bacterium]|nr:hypothetical protein [Ktedonobacterales bacterium]